MSLRDPDAADLARRLHHASEAGADAAELSALLHEVDRLFARHQDRVYAYCLRFVGRPEQAMDLAQDTLLRAYQKLPGFRGEARFDTWLLKIARYNCLNAIRKKRDVLASDGIIETEDAASETTYRRLRREEQEGLLRAASRAVLDEQEQEAVYLRYVEQVGIDEITSILGIEAKSGARGVLQRCKRRLQRELKRRLDELGHGSSFFGGSLG